MILISVARRSLVAKINHATWLRVINGRSTRPRMGDPTWVRSAQKPCPHIKRVFNRTDRSNLTVPTLPTLRTNDLSW